MLFPDYPHDFEAWEIDRQTLSLGRAVETPAEVSVLNEQGLRGGVEFHRALGVRSRAMVRYRLDAFQPVLHVEYEIDWHEEMTLLKALFPTAYTGRLARFGAPFGSVLRGQLAGPLRDEALFEGAASRWAIVSDDGETEGLGVITEAKYGFSCRDGALGVSLLRAPHVTGADPGHQRIFPPPLRRGPARPPFSDQGRHVIRLALCLHTPQTPRDASAPMLAETLFTPPLAYRGKAAAAGLHGLDGLESVVPSWAKPAADGRGWVLRLHETMGRRGSVRLRLAPGLRAYRTDLGEARPERTAAGEITVAPYELISLQLR